MMPTNRTKNCIGILRNALINRDVRPSLTDRAVRKRCTWLWSQPKYERKRNRAAMVPDQIVYFSVRSKLKSTVSSLPRDPAKWSPSPTETPVGNCETMTISMTDSPKKMTIICFTSVHVTACTPPIIV